MRRAHRPALCYSPDGFARQAQFLREGIAYPPELAAASEGGWGFGCGPRLRYVAAVLLTPFPYWPTWFKLWKAVLFDRGAAYPALARIQQAGLLLRYALLHPVFALLWGLDELLFPGYRSRTPHVVFLTGQPRSGTTFLHRILATDEGTFVAVRHIEWRLPFLSVQKLIRALGLSEWLRRVSFWSDNEEGRKAAKMHPNNLYDWEEDGIFFEERFLHHYFVLLRFPYLALLTHLDDFGTLPDTARRRMLATHRKVIQKMAYLARTDCLYLSKEVESVTKLCQLDELYPDARYVILARNSADFMTSLLSRIASSTTSKTGVDTSLIPAWRERAIAKKRQDCATLLEFLQRVPQGRQLRLSFEQFTHDIPGTVGLIYEHLGRRLTPEVLATLDNQGREQPARDRGYEYQKSGFEGFEPYDAFVAEVDEEHCARLDKCRTPRP
ncbi:MAG: sulfotransferase [Planctomycetes bacterium]|nr:sulfotransferase [Planctomycetota bacterium]